MGERAVECQKMIERLRNNGAVAGLPQPKYAVMLPLVYYEDGFHILFEVRAAGISQAGDPCFPGGRIEQHETPEVAALRELREELGITADASQIVCRLPMVNTFFGQQTDIFVGVIPAQAAESLQICKTEVDEVLSVPLSFFLEHSRDSSYDWNGHTIWGMTAGAVRHFCVLWNRLR